MSDSLTITVDRPTVRISTGAVPTGVTQQGRPGPRGERGPRGRPGPPGTSSAASGIGSMLSRPFTPPGAFLATQLNSPTIGTITQPTVGLTMSAAYTTDKMYYRELEAAPGETWTRILHARATVQASGYCSFNLGMRMSGGKYYIAGPYNDAVFFGQHERVARYNSSGVYETGQNQLQSAIAAWRMGLWMKCSYDSTANTLGAGAGELSLWGSDDGYNWDVVTQIGNIATNGTVAGIGFSIELGGVGISPYTMAAILDSWETA